MKPTDITPKKWADAWMPPAGGLPIPTISAAAALLRLPFQGRHASDHDAINMVKGPGPVLVIAEGHSVHMDRDMHDKLI